MKLTKVERGASVTSKLKLVGIRALALGTRPPDVVRVLIYRPELFGKHVIGEFDKDPVHRTTRHRAAVTG